jgi:hypothetical protein
LLFVIPELCDRCGAPLVEIDHYGERLIGCVECNRLKWRWGLVIEVPESDLEARKAVEALILGTANRGSAGSPNCLQAKVLRGITRSRRVKTDGKLSVAYPEYRRCLDPRRADAAHCGRSRSGRGARFSRKTRADSLAHRWLAALSGAKRAKNYR